MSSDLQQTFGDFLFESPPRFEKLIDTNVTSSSEKVNRIRKQTSCLQTLRILKISSMKIDMLHKKNHCHKKLDFDKILINKEKHVVLGGIFDIQKIRDGDAPEVREFANNDGIEAEGSIQNNLHEIGGLLYLIFVDGPVMPEEGKENFDESKITKETIRGKFKEYFTENQDFLNEKITDEML